MRKGFKVLGLLSLSVFGLLSFCNANEFVKVYNFESMSVNSCTSDCFCSTNYSNSPGQGDFEVFVFDNKGHTINGIKYQCDTPGNATYYFTGENNINFNIPINHGYCKVSVIFEGSTNNNFSSCPSVAITKTSSCPECQECETCPEVDTGSILSGYVAVSDIDMSYCVSNDLCPEMSGGYSALFINDIRHESMPFINITIPEEFNWYYSYTGNNTQFDLTVLGYNTDSDYIAGIINTQNSKPNSTDFNNIVSGLIPLLIPGLVIILFVWFIFRFIKKIF